MSTTTTNPLRQRMIEDMTARKFGLASQRSHIESCERFAAYLKRSPATATPDDVRLFQLDLIESGLSIPNRNRIMSGAKFLFRVTLRRPDLVSEVFHMKEPEKVPLILSQDETKRLLAMAGCLRDRLLLSLGYGAGLRAGEVIRLRVKHIDSAQNIIRVEQSKGRKDRLVMLSPETLGMLREWWKARPTRWDAMMSSQDRLLFPGRKPGEPLTTRRTQPAVPRDSGCSRDQEGGEPALASAQFRDASIRSRCGYRTIQRCSDTTSWTTTARYTRVAAGMISGMVSPLDDLSTLPKTRKKEPASA